MEYKCDDPTPKMLHKARTSPFDQRHRNARYALKQENIREARPPELQSRPSDIIKSVVTHAVRKREMRQQKSPIQSESGSSSAEDAKAHQL